jgi:hypothetical protein
MPLWRDLAEALARRRAESAARSATQVDFFLGD